MASTSKHLNEENVLDIQNESDECLISDSSDDSHDSAADVDEEGEVEEEDQGLSLGVTNYNSSVILEDVDNYHGQCELFSGHSGPQNSTINIEDIVCLFSLFSGRDIVYKIVVETNRYAEKFMNSRGKHFTLRSLVRQWTPVTENEIYIVLGFYLLMGFVQKPILRTCVYSLCQL
jgi:hypothetical protein